MEVHHQLNFFYSKKDSKTIIYITVLFFSQGEKDAESGFISYSAPQINVFLYKFFQSWLI